jgi:hypothetical protein
MIIAECLFLIAGVQYKPCRTGTNMGVTKGAHVVTEMHGPWFNKEHVAAVGKNNVTQRSLPMR